jgi:hypothetical protein
MGLKSYRNFNEKRRYSKDDIRGVEVENNQRLGQVIDVIEDTRFYEEAIHVKTWPS